MIIFYVALYLIVGYLTLGLLALLSIWAYYKINNFYMGGGGWVEIYPAWLMYLIGWVMWPISVLDFFQSWKARKKRREEALKRLHNER